MYFVNNQNQIEVINVDLILSDTEISNCTERGFRFLREQPFFKEIEQPHYVVWADCGKHFRSQIFIGYLFNELKKHNIQVNLNFYVDHHGKSPRDAHFISFWSRACKPK